MITCKYLEYSLPNGKMLRISYEILKIFEKHKQKKLTDFESGGILLGNVFDDYILIKLATTPGKGEHRGINFFFRNKKRAQEIVNRTFERSNGRLIYVGEWHTHRQENLEPSIKDKYEINRAFLSSKLNMNYLICIIVGNKQAAINLWVGFQNNKGLSTCNLNL